MDGGERLTKHFHCYMMHSREQTFNEVTQQVLMQRSVFHILGILLQSVRKLKRRYGAGLNDSGTHLAFTVLIVASKSFVSLSC